MVGVAQFFSCSASRRCTMKFALAAICLAVAVQTGSALKCYSCNTNENKMCRDPFLKENSDMIPQIECNDEVARRAYKGFSSAFNSATSFLADTFGVDFKKYKMEELKLACAKVDFALPGGGNMTRRSCSFEPTKELDLCKTLTEEAAKIGPDRAVTHCSTCSSDLCNSAPVHFTSIAALLSIPAVLFLTL